MHRRGAAPVRRLRAGRRQAVRAHQAAQDPGPVPGVLGCPEFLAEPDEFGLLGSVVCVGGGQPRPDGRASVEGIASELASRHRFVTVNWPFERIG